MRKQSSVTEEMRIKLWTYVVYDETHNDMVLTTRYRTRNSYKYFGENNLTILAI